MRSSNAYPGPILWSGLNGTRIKENTLQSSCMEEATDAHALTSMRRPGWRKETMYSGRRMYFHCWAMTSRRHSLIFWYGSTNDSSSTLVELYSAWRSVNSRSQDTAGKHSTFTSQLICYDSLKTMSIFNITQVIFNQPDLNRQRGGVAKNDNGANMADWPRRRGRDVSPRRGRVEIPRIVFNELHLLGSSTLGA